MSDFDSFLESLKSHIVLSDCLSKHLSWDQRKSKPQKGDYWACCPFHKEKSSSFHVEDSKGYYYCFGCHESGDAFTFLQKIENKTFMEAAETLASQYGLTVPKMSPNTQADRSVKTIYDAMQAACDFYKKRAPQAKTFFQDRSLDVSTIQEFSLGFAPQGNNILYEQLIQEGFTQKVLHDAGLIGLSEKDGRPYDRFRDRIIFPILDLKGRCIAFGGRALSKNAHAKYLNSPETSVFHKGKTLYNIDKARKYVSDDNPLIVTEGYMDVIALFQAGFKTAVAPLGTAITPEQIMQLWRFSNQPYIAFDGDEAGQRATEKLAFMALEKIKPGKTLQFLFLSQGQDPDDIISKKGKDSFQSLLRSALPLSDVVWNLTVKKFNFTIPEQRAAFDLELKRIVHSIGDIGVQNHYKSVLFEKRKAVFTHSQPNKKIHPQNIQGYPTLPRANVQQEILLLGYVMQYPALLSDDLEDFANITFQQEECKILHQQILYTLSERPDGMNIEGYSLWTHIDPKYTKFIENNVLIKRVVEHKSNISLAEVKNFYMETLQTHKKLRINRHELENAKSDLCSDYAITASKRLNTLINTSAYERNDENKADDRHYTEQIKQILDKKVWVKNKTVM